MIPYEARVKPEHQVRYPELQADGWYLVRTKGSHHQYKHPTKKPVITVAGNPNDDRFVGTLHRILPEIRYGYPGWNAYVFHTTGKHPIDQLDEMVIKEAEFKQAMMDIMLEVPSATPPTCTLWGRTATPTASSRSSSKTVASS